MYSFSSNTTTTIKTQPLITPQTSWVFAAKRLANEVGSSFCVIESPIVKSNSAEIEPSCVQNLVLQPSNLVPHNWGPIVSNPHRFLVTCDVQSQMVKLLSPILSQSLLPLSSFSSVDTGDSVDADLLSKHYTFWISVDGLRVALNNAGRLPIRKLGNTLADKMGFEEL
ncbi:unnamed protein product [Amaranthus hypochondriacus]